MANKIKKTLSMVLVMCMLISALPMQALAADGTEPDTKLDLSGSVVAEVLPTVTNTSYDENGVPTVEITIQQTNTSGTSADGATVTGQETVTDTTTFHPDGSVQIETVVEGTEKKEWKDVEVQPGQKVPEIEVALKNGETTTGKADNKDNPVVDTVGTAPSEGVPEYDQTTTTTTTEREAQATVDGLENGFKVDGFTTEVNSPVGPEDYEGKNVTSWPNANKPYIPGLQPYTNPSLYKPNVPVKPDDDGLGNGYDFLWAGYGDVTESAAPVIIKKAAWLKEVYVTDENGNKVLDENGNPVIDLKESILDMENTEFMAGHLAHNETGMVSQTFQFALQHVNGEFFYAYCMDQATGIPKSGVWYQMNNLEDAVYSEENQDGHLTEEQAAMIRAIAEKGYWGTDPNVYETDSEGNIIYNDVTDAEGNLVYETKYVNELDENGNIIIVEDEDGNRSIKRKAVQVPVREAVVKRDKSGNPITDPNVQGSIESLKQLLRDTYTVEKGNTTINVRYPGSNDEFPVDIIGLIDSLSEHEALAVTQAAIWAYANGNDSKYVTPQGQVYDIGNGVYAPFSGEKQFSSSGSGWREYDLAKDLNSDARMLALFQALINLDPIYANNQNRKDTKLIPDGEIFGDMSLVIKDKVEDATATNENGETVETDVYNTDLSFTLAFVPDKNSDNLLVYLYNGTEVMKDSNGDPIVRRLAGKNADGEEYEGVIYDKDTDSYLLTGLQLSENTDYTFNLQLQGTQHLEKGVYIYQAKGGRTASQTLVGIAEGNQQVEASCTFSLSFSVDESNTVVAEREWRDEHDPVVYPPNPVMPINDEPDPVAFRLANDDTVIEEEPVPLAAPVTTGDSSVLWIAVIMMAMFAIVAINFPAKKRENETF